MEVMHGVRRTTSELCGMVGLLLLYRIDFNEDRTASNSAVVMLMCVCGASRYINDFL